jgi:trehalose 2-sulfotransferase
MIRLADCFPDRPADAPPLRNFDWAQSGVGLPYVIFITGRCGSTLLTQLLAKSGLCGNPDEFFNEERVVDLAKELGATDFPGYFHAVVAHNAGNHRFGFEIDPFRFQQLRELIAFTDIFPPSGCVFFWMTRRDIVSQAWSYAKAKKTGLWHRFADGSEKRGPASDVAGATIDDTEWWREIILVLIAERLMEDYFATAGITPYRLDYEMLVTDQQRTVVSVLQALSCGPEEIAQNLGPRADHTERNHYDDWPRAMIDFCHRYRGELQRVEGFRLTVDIEGLRQELNARHGLTV